MRVEVRQIWKESSEDKTGWDLVQRWITISGDDPGNVEIIETDWDKHGHPIKGYFEINENETMEGELVFQPIRVGDIVYMMEDNQIVKKMCYTKKTYECMDKPMDVSYGVGPIDNPSKSIDVVQGHLVFKDVNELIHVLKKGV